MSVKIGNVFDAADENRRTEVNYQGTEYIVQEQLWKHEDVDDPAVWQVGVKLHEPPKAVASDVKELVSRILHPIEKIEVVRRLDYRFKTMSGEQYAIFEKEADTSGLEVFQDE